MLDMASEKETLVVKHITAKEINNHIRKLEKVAKKVNRLQFIQQMYHDKSVDEASKILKIPNEQHIIG